MSLRNAVTPRNDAFAGGTLARNGKPPDVGGSFGTPGAAGFTAPGVPSIVSARNNSGSNVRIPYARVVPLHAKDALPVNGRSNKTAYEYEGLESGELAWVLGRQLKMESSNQQAVVQYPALAGMPLQPPGDAMPIAQFPSPQPNGYGPDRMQRLAYTAWIESHFQHRVGMQPLMDLKAFDMFSETNRTIDSELSYWYEHGAKNADLFACPDLAYIFQSPISSALKELKIENPMPQGLFVMERGPFLRSIGTNHRPITVEAQIMDNDGNFKREFIKKHVVNRHIGSDLAQKGLELCLKQMGVFTWVPDGICLSKYETGPNDMADAEMDARASQLFNIAVQGPAITMTWTNDPKLQAMPMDKVFILVVGDLSYSLTNDADEPTLAHVREVTRGTSQATRNPVDNKRRMLHELTATQIAKATNFNDADRLNNDAEELGTTAAFDTWLGRTGVEWSNAEITAGNAAGADKRRGIRGYQQSVQERKTEQADALKKQSETFWTTYRAVAGLGPGAPNSLEKVLEDFDVTAAAVRRGERAVGKCQLSNLRIMRATSSYMAQYSHYRPNGTTEDKAHSRFGLPIAFDNDTKTGNASYVVGGWCIGTVIDSAASRSVVNNTVRTAPASMALNISVNVEWWNADKLYQHYQDRERYVKSTASIAQAVGFAGPDATPANVENDPGATLDRVRLSRPAGTMATRDLYREAESAKYSLDLDVEAFNEPDVRTHGADFKRGWTLY